MDETISVPPMLNLKILKKQNAERNTIINIYDTTVSK